MDASTVSDAARRQVRQLLTRSLPNRRPPALEQLSTDKVV
jgi:hypothetical protein